MRHGKMSEFCSEREDILTGLLGWCFRSSKVWCHLLSAHCPLELMVSYILDPLALSEPVVDRWNIGWFPRPGEQGWLVTERKVGKESSACTRHSIGTGSKSSSEHGRRLAGRAQCLGFSSPSANLTGDGIQRRGSWLHLGGRKRLWSTV